MKALTKLKDQARTFEQKEDWEKAIEVYLQVLRIGEDEGEVELPLYNRIGDLYVRLGKPEDAVNYYEQAADRYAAEGLYNNAIALCNKALRYVPKRWRIYRKLGSFSASQGFLTDARRWFLEYAEQMFKAGQVDDALSALVDFANIAEDAETRELLGRQLKAHGRDYEAVTELRRAYQMRVQAGQQTEADALAAEIRELDPDASLDEVAAPPPAHARSDDAPYEVELPGLSDLGIESAAGAAFGSDAGVGLDAGNITLDEGPLEIGSAPVEFDHSNIDLEDGPVSLDEPDALPLIDLDSGGEEAEEEAAPLPTFDMGDAELGEPLPLIDLDAEEEASGDFAVDLPTFSYDDETYEEEAEPLPSFSLDSDLALPTYEEPVAASEPEPERPRVPELQPALARARDQLNSGDRAGAVDTLQQLHEMYAEAEEYGLALSALAEQLRLDPNNVGLLQQRVEYAVRLGEQAPLLSAYIDLADRLVKTGSTTKARAVYARVLDLDPTNLVARTALDEGKPKPPRAEKKKSDFIDLNSLLQDDEDEENTTRFVVAEKPPTGDEERDFADLLSQFKAKVAENVGADDPSSHYDLGLAFKEMGLIDEAIGEFQIALKAGREKLQVYEELGQCFMLKEQYNVAVKVLSRALQLPHQDESELLGVYYHLGRCFEELGHRGEAKDAYERVIGLDIQFRDVSDRLARL